MDLNQWGISKSQPESYGKIIPLSQVRDYLDQEGYKNLTGARTGLGFLNDDRNLQIFSDIFSESVDLESAVAVHRKVLTIEEFIEDHLVIAEPKDPSAKGTYECSFWINHTVSLGFMINNRLTVRIGLMYGGNDGDVQLLQPPEQPRSIGARLAGYFSSSKPTSEQLEERFALHDQRYGAEIKDLST